MTMMMKRPFGAWRFTAVAGLSLAFAATASMAEPLDQSAERGRIQQERAQADALFKEREQACLQRFVVTPCTDKARRQRRETLSQLKQQENLLDDEQRKQRTADRAKVLADKASQKQARDAGGDAAAPAADAAASAAAPGVDAASAPRQPSRPGRAVTPGQADAQARELAAGQAAKGSEASQRAQAQRKKVEAAQRRKAEVERRNAEQAQSAKPASPGLPAPPAASAP